MKQSLEREISHNINRTARTMKFIDFHNKCIENNRNLERYVSALCDEFHGNKTFRLFEPSIDEQKELPNYDGRELPCDGFAWGSGHKSHKWGIYTKLRETIVLFCAAIEGELDD